MPISRNYSRFFQLFCLVLVVGVIAPPAAWAVDTSATTQTEDKDATADAAQWLEVFPVAGPIDPDQYFCGVGDVFSIQVWGQKELSALAPINVEGELFVPTIGKVGDLAGASLRDAKKRISWRIASVYPGVTFDISLHRARTFIVYVAGHARRPGEHKATALTRISKFVTASGGPNPLGSQRFVEVWRDGRQHALVDLLQIVRDWSAEKDFTLLDGDLVRFPPVERLVDVSGAVKMPGRYELAPGDDLKKLVETHAAGLSDAVSRSDEIEIINRVDSTQFQLRRVTIDGMAAGGVELFDKDRIFVPTLDRYQKVIRVQGAVKGSGRWDIESTVSRTELSGAATHAGPANGGPAPAVNGAVGEGQNPEHFGVYPFVEGETAYSVIQRAGGVTPFADTDHAFIRRRVDGGTYETIPVNLTRILIDRDFSENKALQAGDFVIVPTLENKVFVGGEVVSPGPMPYVPFYAARHYVGLAGGITTRASMRRSEIVHRDGTREDLDLNTIPQPGDTIYVKEQTFKFWQDYWTILTGTAALVLSGFAVIYTIENN